jgi:DNA-binding GntR family transcriptional regulator
MSKPDADKYSHLNMEEVSAPTLADTVAETLRRSILGWKFAPGERLYEAALAREFGISRGPIREALALLETDGLVENIPRRGKFVQQLDSRTIDEIYSLRRIVEPYAAELVVEDLSLETESAIQASLDDLYAAIAGGNPGEVAECDIAFHARMYSVTGHKPLMRTWDDIISNKLRMLIRITTRTHDAISDSGVNHEQIFNAIVSRDVDKCRLLIVEHIDDAWKRAKGALGDLITVPEEVVEFVTTHVSDNNRELEGALTRITAYATLTQQNITVEMATHVLQDLIPTEGAEPHADD